ncbi:hypothetical protein CEXT_335321 [Caerostris extrusa]|uniref:Uncharacterized protein n=1 Tax=Caerostris extrusa TaxID=172846 RepID=A0AAV4NQJ3_CAEEX|nr:hypothetical protein CEXT_335321 [Caerostris extrusa]
MGQGPSPSQLTAAPHHVWGRSDLIITHSSHRGLLIVRTACTTLNETAPLQGIGAPQKDSAFMSQNSILGHGDHESGKSLPKETFRPN